MKPKKRIRKIKKAILKMAFPIEVLSSVSKRKHMPKPIGGTVVFRRCPRYD